MTCTAKLCIEEWTRCASKVKQEAPPPRPYTGPACHCAGDGSPPPRTELPKTKAETKAVAPKTKSVIRKSHAKNSFEASMARLQAAARARREAREACEAQQAAVLVHLMPVHIRGRVHGPRAIQGGA